MKKLLYAVVLLYVIYSILNQFVLSGVTKLLLIPFVFYCITFIGFYGKMVLLDDVRKMTYKENQLKKRREKNRKEEERQESLMQYDTVIKPLYEENRALFARLMKNRAMKSYQIKDFKKLIDWCLGSYASYYHNYKFKNDANEIYVKMKNFNLSKDDWERIHNYLINFENNIPKKSVKSLNQKSNALK